MATRIVKFGVGNVAEKDFPEGATIQQVAGDPEIRGKLGLSSDLARYDAYVRGVNVPMDRLAPPEEVISLQSRQCTKNEGNFLTPKEFTEAMTQLHGEWDGENW